MNYALSRQTIRRTVDRYQAMRAEREPRSRQFLAGTRRFLIHQTPNANIWGDVRSSEQCFYENLTAIATFLDVPSDHLPFLEPWFGTGVYANMYGCPYVWRDGEAPAVHYRYHSLDEVRDLRRPRWQDSEIARLVLDTIRYFKSKTGDALPIVWTDTQSASDTATLVLEAVEVFAACLAEPETIRKFMGQINELVIEFSQAQAELIGSALVHPGHIMLSNAGFTGMSVSDDNLAVASAEVNRRFNLELDEEIGRAMGGVAIHSCGVWTHVMPLIQDVVPSCIMLDCAIDRSVDPCPNTPEAVRDTLVGSRFPVIVRLTGETEAMLETVRRVFHPELKLIVHPGFVDVPTAERNYDRLQSLLSTLYGQKDEPKQLGPRCTRRQRHEERGA
jgi:uroporphyrinogen-III decarboxylase